MDKGRSNWDKHRNDPQCIYVFNYCSIHTIKIQVPCRIGNTHSLTQPCLNLDLGLDYSGTPIQYLLSVFDPLSVFTPSRLYSFSFAQHFPNYASLIFSFYRRLFVWIRLLLGLPHLSSLSFHTCPLWSFHTLAFLSHRITPGTPMGQCLACQSRQKSKFEKQIKTLENIAHSKKIKRIKKCYCTLVFFQYLLPNRQRS